MSEKAERKVELQWEQMREQSNALENLESMFFNDFEVKQKQPLKLWIM